MSKIWELKKILKEKAVEIRKTKEETKELQRDGTYAGDLQSSIRKDKAWYRYRHIAYCLLRGRKYEEIEKPRQDNPPNWEIIKEVQNAYTENVCSEPA